MGNLLLVLLFFGHFAEGGKYELVTPKGGTIPKEVLSDKEARSIPLCKELMTVFKAKYCPASVKKLMKSRLVSKKEIAKWQRDNRHRFTAHDYIGLQSEGKMIAQFKLLYIKALNKRPHLGFHIDFESLRIGVWELTSRAIGTNPKDVYYLPIQMIILKHKLQDDFKIRDNLREYRKYLLSENNHKGVLT